ncbi:MAG: endonuclease/exonuclease/phosphatase family protein, partial [Candidatus Binataceae bacterium]
RLNRPPLRGATVILLCEADWKTRRSEGLEVAAELAGRLGLSFAYAPGLGIKRRGRPGFTGFVGNAILCAEPLHDVRMVPLPGLRPPGRRTIFHGMPVGFIATAILDGHPVTLGVAHLERWGGPQFRAEQLGKFLKVFPAHGPAIIGGDFNTATTEVVGGRDIVRVMGLMLAGPRRFRDPVPYEPLFGLLREAGFEIDGANLPLAPTFTFTRLIPRLLRPKLDWIAIRGLRAVPGSAAVVAPRTSAFAPRVSDHDFIVCDVEP